jgi:hypothetical protein
MTVVTNALSSGIASLDTNPANIPLTGFLGIQGVTAGEGGVVGNWITLVDQLPVSTAFLGASGNWGRLCRFPATAKLVMVEIGTDVVLDTANPQTLAFDVSVGFSDSLGDGTPYYFQNMVPSQTLPLTVSNVVTPAAATRNKLFGLVTLSANGGTTAPISFTELTQNAQGTGNNLTFAQSGVTIGMGSTLVGYYKLLTTPVLRSFGATTTQGIAIDNAGWMDLIINVTVAATTAVAGNILGRIHWVI